MLSERCECGCMCDWWLRIVPPPLWTLVFTILLFETGIHRVCICVCVQPLWVCFVAFWMLYYNVLLLCVWNKLRQRLKKSCEMLKNMWLALGLSQLNYAKNQSLTHTTHTRLQKYPCLQRRFCLLLTHNFTQRHCRHTVGHCVPNPSPAASKHSAVH